MSGSLATAASVRANVLSLQVQFAFPLPGFTLGPAKQLAMRDQLLESGKFHPSLLLGYGVTLRGFLMTPPSSSILNIIPSVSLDFHNGKSRRIADLSPPPSGSSEAKAKKGSMPVKLGGRRKKISREQNTN